MYDQSTGQEKDAKLKFSCKPLVSSPNY